MAPNIDERDLENGRPEYYKLLSAHLKNDVIYLCAKFEEVLANSDEVDSHLSESFKIVEECYEKLLLTKNAHLIDYAYEDRDQVCNDFHHSEVKESKGNPRNDKNEASSTKRHLLNYSFSSVRRSDLPSVSKSGELENIKDRLKSMEAMIHKSCFSQIGHVTRNNESAFKPTIPIFTGMSEEFPRFEATFDTFVGNAAIEPALKLNILIQYCSGLAYDSIKDFVLMKNGEGYSEARKLLKQRFGNPHIISHNLIDNLTNGAVINPFDATSLQALSSDMKRCSLTLSSLDFHVDIDNCGILLKVMKRLPEDMQEKWAELAFELSESGREPTFNDLHEFVEKMSRISSNLYGRSLFVRDNTSRPTSTESTEDEIKCSKTNHCGYCNSDHNILHCNKFGSLRVEAKRKYMFRTRRCYICLQRGHIARGCLSNARCEHCNGKHNSWFHRQLLRRKINGANAGVDDDGASGGLVVPVTISSSETEIETNAILDITSPFTYCSNSIMRKFSTGNDVRSNVRVKIISMDEKGCVNMRKLTDKENSIMPHISESFHNKHRTRLNFMHPKLHPGGIGIVIGRDVPAAFDVTDTKMLADDKIQASRCILGWGIHETSFN